MWAVPFFRVRCLVPNLSRPSSVFVHSEIWVGESQHFNCQLAFRLEYSKLGPHGALVPVHGLPLTTSYRRCSSSLAKEIEQSRWFLRLNYPLAHRLTTAEDYERVRARWQPVVAPRRSACLDRY